MGILQLAILFGEKILPYDVLVRRDDGVWIPGPLKMLDVDWQGKPWKPGEFNNIGPKPGNGFQEKTDCQGRFADGPYGLSFNVPFSVSWEQDLQSIAPDGSIINLGTNKFSQYSFEEGQVRWRLENKLFGTFGVGK